MSEFTPIETQEQLDKVIGERVRRAERQAAEKYADYDDIKKEKNTTRPSQTLMQRSTDTRRTR